jgi:hypothetical protein
VKELKSKYEHLMGGDGWSRLMVEMSRLRESDQTGEYRGYVDRDVALAKLKTDKMSIGTWDGTNLVSSQCSDGFHRLVIDVDMDARVDWTEWGKSVLTCHQPEKEVESFFGSRKIKVPAQHFAHLLDGQAWAVPSSHKNHFHVYSDAPYTWGEYFELLKQLRQEKIVDQRYYLYSIERGFTAVRKPWVRKLGR